MLESLGGMDKDAQIVALKEFAIKQDELLKRIQSDGEEFQDYLNQINGLIQEHLKPIPEDIPNDELKEELMILMMASGKEREECLSLVEKTMKKIEQDPVGKKGFIQNLNKTKSTVPPAEEIAN